MQPGLIALIAALAAALVGGTGWRLTSGRMRAPRPARAGQQPAREPELAVAQVAAVQVAAGQPGGDSEPALTAAEPGRDRLTSEQLGQPLGERATLVQFSSAFCAPCRATRRILDDVAQLTDGVSHVEIDAESHLDLVRQLNVLRTPTVLVLDAGGAVVRRASGQPRKPDVIAAISVAAGL